LTHDAGRVPVLIEKRPVSARVGNVKNNDPSLIEPVPA
jgi:hypothetical protein